MRLTGYADPMVVKAGGRVDFMISGTDGTADIKLVRLIHGDVNPDGPGFVEAEVDIPMPMQCTVRPQRTQFGSFARVPRSRELLGGLKEATLYAFISPSRPGSSEQVIAGCFDGDQHTGYSLLLDANGSLTFRWGQGNDTRELTLAQRCVPRCWYFVAASWSRSKGVVELLQMGVVNHSNSAVGTVPGFDLDDLATIAGDINVDPSSRDLLIAGSEDKSGWVAGLFDGKIDRPGVHSRALSREEIRALARGDEPNSADIAARWDTSLGYTESGIGDDIVDVGPHGLTAVGVNRPVRGMTGWNWDGSADSFRLNPSLYGGIAFHSDALIDCAWVSSVALDLPKSLRSGAYALRVRLGQEEDHIPIFVRSINPTGRVAVLLSTFTYLAYANESMPLGAETIRGVPLVISEKESQARSARAYGLSTYDTHVDGAGVCFSSWRRPIRNLRPKFRMESLRTAWAFPADLSLIWWLEEMNYDYDVITDHDLDREAHAALSPYKAVITSTHPEYYSSRMMDGLSSYLSAGGRLLYLGGNGFYWVTETRDAEPWCIEIRRLNSGIRAWEGQCGEGYLVTTGQKSGLWRDRGRPPQKMVGVGFTTEGFDRSKPFERLSDSFDPKVAWIFEGIGKDELIGDFGLGLGGASGLELDRYDLALGTPPHTRLLCASFGHSDAYPLVPEEMLITMPGYGGTQHPYVRGDVTYFTTAKGGAVFSAGSIAWSQALPINGGNNNVATITRNVIDAFVSRATLPEL